MARVFTQRAAKKLGLPGRTALENTCSTPEPAGSRIHEPDRAGRGLGGPFAETPPRAQRF